MSNPHQIPRIDVGALWETGGAARDAVDKAISAAAHGTGFMVLTGFFDPARPNVDRGWFPVQDGHPTYKEGIDMGPDDPSSGRSGAP